MDKQKGVGDRVIYNYIPLERSMTFTIEELGSLLRYFDYGHPHRLVFMIMALCGLRSGEACKIKIDMFGKDFNSLTYPVAKPVTKYKTKARIINTHVRTVKVPGFLSKELRFFAENNYLTFKNGYLFGFTKDSLRRYLGKLRRKADLNQIGDDVLKNMLLDSEVFRYGFGVNVQPSYRFTLHSFRRFYTTWKYWIEYDQDIILTQLDLGHSLKETTMVYVKRPGDIGLTPELLKKKESLDILLNKNQSTLNEF